MKPVKLTMSAFGPFAELVEIDFAKFERGGLFLLSGETGAGKTTVFDGVSYALFGEVSGETRGKENLRSDFAKPETDTFVRLDFEHRGINYSILRSPEYERKKLRGDDGMTKSVATVEFKMPDRIIAKTREANAAVEELLSVTYNQFKQIMMIAQGEFLALITASSDERSAIMRRVFGTAIYEDVQIKLKDRSLELKHDYDTLKDEQIRLESGFISDVDTSAEYIESLAKTRGEIKSELDALAVKTELAKQFNAELSTLDANRKKLEENKISGEKTELELAALKDDEPRRKRLEQTALEIETALPKYEEFTKKTFESAKKAKELSENETEYAKILGNIAAEKEEFIKVKSLLESLASAEIDAVTLKNELESAIDKAGRVKVLAMSHDDWKTKNAVYETAQEEYFTGKKLFDDGLAGRLAGSLADGEPCPVCGSKEHPNKAKPLEKSPTQAEFEKSEKLYKKAHEEIIAANEKRGLLSGELDILPENAADNILAQVKTVMKLTQEKEQADASLKILNEARLREKQIAADLEIMTEREKTLRENISELRTAVEISRLEAEVLKKDLKQANEASAKLELDKTKSELIKYEKDLQTKSEEYQLSRDEISRFAALIENGEKSLGEISDKLGMHDTEKKSLDINEFEARKSALTLQSEELEKQERAALSAKETNERIQNELLECKIKLEVAEKNYGDADLIARTANGNLKEKNKLRFETYVQQVYFDMILAEASERFSVMTDGRFELIRQSADKIQGKAGLDVDVFDNWTQTVRPAKSLSGGQSFMAALALALGLSDVAQSHSGGIQIDAMFIDEGFGSLDGESLECAMNVIAGLADGNRLVGIISHVDALKERIPDKILIERGKTGSRIVQG